MSKRLARAKRRSISRQSRVCEALESRTMLTGSVAFETHGAFPVAGLGTMLLLTDGSVMAQAQGTSKQWLKLTPDSSGSYSTGSWVQLAPMGLARLYFASNVLPDGRVFVYGGEYSGPAGAQNWVN